METPAGSGRRPGGGRGTVPSQTQTCRRQETSLGMMLRPFSLTLFTETRIQLSTLEKKRKLRKANPCDERGHYRENSQYSPLILLHLIKAHHPSTYLCFFIHKIKCTRTQTHKQPVVLHQMAAMPREIPRIR